MTTAQVDVKNAARGLASALEGDWKVFPGYWSERDAFVRSAAGDGLHVQQVLSTARLSVSGELGVGEERLHDFWPRGDNRSRRTHAITVSAAKTAAQIARDVERRLLPAYRTALTQARASRSAHDAREAATEGLTGEIADILGGTVAAGAHGTVRVGSWGDGLHGVVRLTDGDAQFELWVPRELAAEFARLAAGLAGGAAVA